MLTLACLFTLSASAWDVKVNSKGEPLRWGQKSVEFWVNPKGNHGLSTEEVEIAVEQAVAQWNDVYPDEVQLVYRGLSDAPRKVDYTDDLNIIYFEDVWAEDLDSSLLALTWVWSVDGGEITSFDIQINAEDHRWGVGATDGSNDLANMLTHELGHALGLGHSEVHLATMSPTTFPGETEKRSIETDDRDAIAWLYSQALPDSLSGGVGGCIPASGTELAFMVPGIFMWGVMRRRSRSDLLS